MSVHSERPNPDELLARLHAEGQPARGKLRMLLGYAAGVGKTYAMLEAAHQRLSEGVDAVVAYAESHGRAETDRLLQGLEVIPRRTVAYHGLQVSEMDVDAVLARKPQLALVDELAHTNAPGSRHAKRYQDVEELLAAGIDVYTTLNIQHLESLRDVVAQITGVTVRETVPDTVLDQVNEIELIDLSPEELLQRLKEGKVYIPEQAARAIQQFFRRGNLTALREMAMRHAAESVDSQMRSYMRSRDITGPWPASERLLVCVSAGPLSERLVRAGRRLANELHAEWFTLYVQTAADERLPQNKRERVARAMQLAEELGSRVRTLPGTSVAESISAYARKHNITKIIVGRPLRPRWRELWRGSLVDQIIHASGHVDVHVISAAPEEQTPPATPPKGERRSWTRYLLSVLLVCAATLLSVPIQLLIPPTNLVMVYLAAVMLAAIYLGRGPAMLAAFLSVVSFDFFFVPPSFTFAVSDTQYVLTFMGLFVVGLVISHFVARASDQARMAQRREAVSASLYAFSRELTGAVTLEDIGQVIVRHVGEDFRRDVVLLLPAGERLAIHTSSPKATLDESELAVATWTYKQGRPAGRGTDTLPAARVRYLPLKTPHGVVGVLGVEPPMVSGDLAPEQRQQMETFASQAALAIERVQLAEEARYAEVARNTEKLQTALLNTISHNLRTPLATITGVLSTLNDEGAQVDGETRRNLTETASQEAERLNRLVGNLLDMTRLEAGAVKLVREPCEVADVIGAALEQLSGSLKGRQVRTDAPADLPLVSMDFVLIQQVLVNLLDNAVKYSASEAPIEVTARLVDGEVEIEVADRGVGIAPEDLTRVFDKFFRVHHPGRASGSGLGLTICRGIVEIHGGRIWAQNRTGGGTVVAFRLPLGTTLGASHE
jgi:two-component system sensor histidine kinase KdpD